MAGDVVVTTVIQNVVGTVIQTVVRTQDSKWLELAIGFRGSQLA